MAIQQSINSAIGSFAALGVIGKHFDNQDILLETEKSAIKSVKQDPTFNKAEKQEMVDEQIQEAQERNWADQGFDLLKKAGFKVSQPLKSDGKSDLAMQTGENYGKSQHEVKTYTSLLHQFLEEHPSGGAK